MLCTLSKREIVMSRFTGETTREFKSYYKLEIARIKLENFQTPYESYVEDLVLFKYYAETEDTHHLSEITNIFTLKNSRMDFSGS